MDKHFYLPIIAVVIVTSSVIFLGAKDNSPLKQTAQANQTTFQSTADLKYNSINKPEDHAPIIQSQEEIDKGDAIRIPILMYHHIGTPPQNADGTRKDLTVSPEEFDSQAAWLSKNGYTSLTLDDLYQYSQKKKISWPAKPVIFTFDDGYSDVFENAVPVLKKYNFTGVFGVITGFAGQTHGDNVYGSWAQVSEAKSNGMEIVCHTQNHFDGSSTKFDSEYIYKNLSGCQKDLTTHLGTSEPYLIYPYGHYTADYITQAERAGFVMSLTVHSGTTVYAGDLMRVPRVRVHPNEPLDKFIERLKE